MVEEIIAHIEQMEKKQLELREILVRDRKELREILAKDKEEHRE